ncbi:hypothetical protein [Chamaesiphon minutus]|uniref:Uncharacterized protein n=1 Tax=Chamaesiphon minutus (strain ATCC 27169 / PCC 6605) TaxID=1173020 RepID=K9UNK7_CHAP6|nr:hypothetical protein [Chamaesiphon minutus]AFY95759.1 hypothetical protein Cha6605_4846 [Chamaesiphon minutus PCC 6605]
MSFDSLEFITLLISIAIEATIVSTWGKFRNLEWRLLAIVAAASTLITHPILWKVFNDLLPTINGDRSSDDRYNNLALLLEVPVVIAEGSIYKWVMKYSWLAGMSISLMANLASYLFGVCFLNTTFD